MAQKIKFWEQKEKYEEDKIRILQSMETPKFCMEGEENDDPNLISLPLDEELLDDPSDRSHPNIEEKVLDPEILEGTSKVLAKSNWSWKFKKDSKDLSEDDEKFE